MSASNRKCPRCERYEDACNCNYSQLYSCIEAKDKRIAELEHELHEIIGAVQEALKLLKGNKIVHSTLSKELIEAAKKATGPKEE